MKRVKRVIGWAFVTAGLLGVGGSICGAEEVWVPISLDRVRGIYEAGGN